MPSRVGEAALVLPIARLGTWWMAAGPRLARLPLVFPELSPASGVSPALAERPPSSRLLH